MIDIAALIASYRMRDESFGPLTEPQWRMLMDIQENGATRVTAVSAASGVAATTALRHLDILQDEGFVTRTPDRSDRRVDIISLTDKAETSFAVFLDRMARHEASRQPARKAA